MELHARLVHAEAGHRVVEVRATRGELPLGSALGEATTAQDAEEIALDRLLRRLGSASAQDPGAEPAERPPGPAAPAVVTPPPLQPAVGGGAATVPATDRPADPAAPRPGIIRHGRRAAVAMPAVAPAAVRPGPPAIAWEDPWAIPDSQASPPQAEHRGQPPSPPSPRHEGAAAPGAEAPPPAPTDPIEEPPADPEDWSQELAALDLQLRRLSWGRAEEGVYLQRAFGHPSRSRLTRYSDLRAYLTALEGLERGSDPAVAAIPLRRSELLAQGDALLAQLGWSPEEGRAFLERELQRVSRQQLSDVQLLQFNMLLEGELLAHRGGGPGASPVAAAAVQQEAQR